MFKKKKNNINTERAIELVKNSKDMLIIMNDEEGMVSGKSDYVAEAFLLLTKKLIKDGIIDIKNILECINENSNMITIKAKTKDEAIKKLEKEMNKIEKKRNKKAEGK